MANVAHKNLTDPELHEPKGVSTASLGQVYVSDGSGSGSWDDLPEVDPSDIELPVGTLVEYAGSTAPDKWLFCYGQAIDRSDYADLFTLIGTTFGVGDGSTTFNIPDCRGRAVAGKDDMGGTSANRLTSPLNGDTLGAAGGDEGHALTAAQVPVLTGSSSTNGAHTHSVTNGTNIVFFEGVGDGVFGGTGALSANDNNISISSAGSHSHDVVVNDGVSASEHNNMQPTIVFTMIIYTGVE